jgi:hypothetical protein
MRPRGRGATEAREVELLLYSQNLVIRILAKSTQG